MQLAPLAENASTQRVTERCVGSRVRPAVMHLLASALLAGLGAFLLVRLWYPYPLSTLAGGLELLAILFSVDVVLGPLLTFVVATPGKRLRVLAKDMAVIVSMQMLALGYG